MQQYKKYWHDFLKFLDDRIIHLGEVRQIDADNFLTSLIKNKISDNLYNQYLLTLNMIFNSLLENKRDNPFKKFGKKTVIQTSHKEFTKEDVLKIFTAFDNPDLKIINKDEMRLLFHIGCWTGLRLKDCCLLEWDCINLEKGFLSVIPSKTKKYNKTVIIPIHPVLHDELIIFFKIKKKQICPS